MVVLMIIRYVMKTVRRVWVGYGLLIFYSYLKRICNYLQVTWLAINRSLKAYDFSGK